MESRNNFGAFIVRIYDKLNKNKTSKHYLTSDEISLIKIRVSFKSKFELIIPYNEGPVPIPMLENRVFDTNQGVMYDVDIYDRWVKCEEMDIVLLENKQDKRLFYCKNVD